ncbi:molybdopterin binding domain containing protein [Coccidioides immitis RMSCC 3703]|uniref:Molybdopterin binding domain containing protein n=1 Tax=Coccidioides immitis RMSCC 3703 TaxID=454286 RepID=A0A0J8QX43_COCIT|nr:molybdopterin binding domain containing protein [Coccidioides immitis RMSCC 3703]
MTSSERTALENSKRAIGTAACLIIGDEVLGGKTVDTNSSLFAKYCFSIGVQLKRVEVIADDEDHIIEAARLHQHPLPVPPSRQVDSLRINFDVYRSMLMMAIYATQRHDDITYQSIAKAFNLNLKFHEEAFNRMRRLSKPQQAKPDFDWDTPSPALTARLRMVHLPTDETRPISEQALFVDDELWVPVSVVNGNIYILPGVPSLFERLLTRLRPILLPKLIDPEGKGIHRLMFATPLYESTIAPYLTDLAARVEPRGIKVGSYPRWGKKRNTVTLVGTDLEYMESLVDEVEKNVQGRRVSREDEDDPVDEPEEQK